MITKAPSLIHVGRWLRELLGPQRLTAARTLADAAWTTLRVHHHGVRGLLPPPTSADADLRAGDAREISRVIDIAFALLPARPTCLRRSVTLLRELHRQHIGAALHIGVRNVSGTVEAHAWVQVGHVIVNDAPSYVATFTELAAGDLERLIPAMR